LTKVLIIDDDITTTDVIKLILEPAGYDVLCVNSGEEGINTTIQWNPDIILMDLIMPNMDGGRVIQTIRSSSSVPILVLSVINNPTLVAQALDEGADDILTKPIRDDVLIANINKLTRRSNVEVRVTPTSK
jgi:DNA-binding response OmpR family regulator